MSSGGLSRHRTPTTQWLMLVSSLGKDAQQACEALAQQYRTLLEVSESIAAHRDLGELFHELAQSLHRVVRFDQMRLTLHDAERNIMRVHILEGRDRCSDPLGCQELPVQDSPGGWAWQTQRPLVVSNLENETRFPVVTALLRQQSIKSFCVVPLTTAQRRLGALVFASLQEAAYDEVDLQFLQQVAKQVAVAVDNALNYQGVQRYQQELSRERDHLRLLLEVNNAVVSNLELKPLFAAITASLRKVIQHEYTSLALYDADSHRLRLHALDFPEGKGLIHEGIAGADRRFTRRPGLYTREPVLAECQRSRRVSFRVRQAVEGRGGPVRL